MRLLVGRRLLMLALIFSMVAGAWFGHGWLASRARARLAQQYNERLQNLPEAAAEQLVRELARDPDAWLELIVSATGDSRGSVAAAAEAELQANVEQWSLLSPAESSGRAGKLARLLADHAPHLPADRRDAAHGIAQRLITWPLDGRQVDAAKLIADCQQVLLLPRSDGAALRMAATPARPADAANSEPPASIAPPAPAVPIATDPVAVSQPLAPAVREDAGREPGRFVAPPKMRIADE